MKFQMLRMMQIMSKRYAHRMLTEQQIKVTPKASARLKEVVDEGERLRLEVDGGGCSGFEYKIRLDKALNEDDLIWRTPEGAEIVVDELSLGYMKGATVDFVEDLMKASFRIMLPSLTRVCLTSSRTTAASFSTMTSSGRQNSRRHQNQRNSQWQKQGNGGKTNGRWGKFGKSATGAGTTVLALSWMTTIKDVLGIDKIQLDADPLKEKVKQSWLYRKRRQYDEAIQVLQLALEEAEERKEELPITRVYDELANTYYEQLNMEEADKYFRIVIQRLVQLHGKRDFDAEFIGVSLKLADILANKGELESAESGFKHCVRRQMKVMEEHMKKFSVAHGALIEDRHTVDTYGHVYTDPIALFGMTLEAYANFLINFCQENRLAEAEEYMDEVMKISYQIYGASSSHTINMLNNFGAALVLKNRFELARKYLAIGVDRILYVNECAHMLPGYYCNYAEALFHTGNKEEALEFARKAVQLARSGDERLRQYTQTFLKDLEKDLNKGKPRSWWFF